MNDEIKATPTGLLQCLRMLSEEAASLYLPQTFAALKDAAAICRAESTTVYPAQETGPTLRMVH